MRAGIFRVLWTGALSVLAVSLTCGFTFIESPNTHLPIKWPEGPVTMLIKLGTSPTLIDGTNYSTSLQSAANTWNSQIGAIQLTTQIVAAGSGSDGTGTNEIFFSNTVYGQAFGSNTIAVTTVWRRSNDRVEADIVFNNNRTWNSYRGALQSGVLDIQRVGLHELGHVLGLDHPDEAGQSVTAVMNSAVSNVDGLRSDDISGAQRIYGPPGIPSNDNFNSAAFIAGTSAQITGYNTNSSKESGEPNHASNSGGHSAWWKWTAPGTGIVTITTQGSIFDTTLAVYTGSSVSSLALVASSDDVQPGVIQYSTVTFTALVGVTYSIAVDGFDADSGGITLNLQQTIAQVLFSTPAGIGLDGTGALYVSDSTLNTIQKAVPSTLVASAVAGANLQAGSADGAGSAARFSQPTGVVGTAAGVLYVSDTANATIRRIAADGTVSTLAGSVNVRGNTDATGTSATFSLPVGLALDSTGNLYVADATNHTIRKVTTGGAVSTFAGGAGTSGTTNGTGTAARFNNPTGIALDASGAVYVADTNNNTVRKITPAGLVSTLAGLEGVTGSSDGAGAVALFNQPGGLAVDAAGNLYLADTGNSIVRKITAAGAVTTVAGLPGVAGLKDGTGSDAWFNQPKSLTVDSAGNVYVADTGNALIRKVTPAGAVTTLALSNPSSSSSSSSSSGASATPAAPAAPAAGGGGGGGAPGGWFLIALTAIWAVRFGRRFLG